MLKLIPTQHSKREVDTKATCFRHFSTRLKSCELVCLIQALGFRIVLKDWVVLNMWIGDSWFDKKIEIMRPTLKRRKSVRSHV